MLSSKNVDVSCLLHKESIRLMELLVPKEYRLLVNEFNGASLTLEGT